MGALSSRNFHLFGQTYLQAPLLALFMLFRSPVSFKTCLGARFVVAPDLLYAFVIFRYISLYFVIFRYILGFGQLL